MEIFKRVTKIDFMGIRHIALGVSVVMVLASVVILSVKGLNFGIDFTGGVVIEVAYPQTADLGNIRGTLDKAGFKDPVVQHFGTSSDVLIRLRPSADESSAAISDRVMQALSAQDARVEKRRVEYVGPQVGQQLAEKGGLAMLFTLIGVLIYVGFRFQIKFAPGAVIALIHDSLITLGWFSFFQVQFDLTVLAAVLAVIGYSLNDTIVVFDRIREDFRIMRKASAPEVMNAAINETLSRTIMTSFATLLVVIALFVVGGEVIHGFALALIIGIVVGTYSSIYVASPLALLFKVDRSDLVPQKKESAADSAP